MRYRATLSPTAQPSEPIMDGARADFEFPRQVLVPGNARRNAGQKASQARVISEKGPKLLPALFLARAILLFRKQFRRGRVLGRQRFNETDGLAIHGLDRNEILRIVQDQPLFEMPQSIDLAAHAVMHFLPEPATIRFPAFGHICLRDFGRLCFRGRNTNTL